MLTRAFKSHYSARNPHTGARSSSVSHKNALTRLIAQLLGVTNSLVIQRPILELLDGDYPAAVFLSQMFYWSDRTDDPEGWFYKSHEEWHAELMLSSKQVARCMEVCAPFVELERRDMRRKTYYRIKDVETLIAKLENRISRDAQRESRETPSSVARETPKPPLVPYRHRLHTETTYIDKTLMSSGDDARPLPSPTRNADEHHDSSDIYGQPLYDHKPAKTPTPPPVKAAVQKSKTTGKAPRQTEPLTLADVPRGAALLAVWNANCGVLPQALGATGERLTALKRMDKDFGDDAPALLADAAREVASDEYWIKRKYGFNYVASKILSKAEMWRAKLAARTDAQSVSAATRSGRVYD